MSRFVNGAVIGVVSFIALVSAFWYSAEIEHDDRVSFVGLESRWGTVDASNSQIRFVLSFHNPHEAQVELVRLDQEVLFNDQRVDYEQRNVTLRLSPDSNRSVELTVEFPNAFLGPWWDSHVRQGEQTKVAVQGTATFMVLQRAVKVPYHWEAEWSTDLRRAVPESVSNCASLVEDPCIRGASLSWETSASPTMHVRLTLQNTNDSTLWLRNWTSHLVLHGVPLATADVVPGPIELAAGAEQELELTFRIDARALASWWQRHVSSCEFSPAATTIRFVREHVVNTTQDPNSTYGATEPATGALIAEERNWTLPGEALTTRFVCVRT